MSKLRKYYKWNNSDLTKALLALEQSKMGLNECSRFFDIPKPTLKRHMMKKNKYANESKIQKGRPTVFNEEIENQLVKHLILLETHMLGLTIDDVRRLAFQLAEKNGIKHNFNKNRGMAGKGWFYKFMRRNPRLSVGQPESTSSNRANGFNTANVNEFCDLLAKIIEKNNIQSNSLFNFNETGFSTVQKKSHKIIGQKEKKEIVVIASVNTTMATCTSAG